MGNIRRNNGQNMRLYLMNLVPDDALPRAFDIINQLQCLMSVSANVNTLGAIGDKTKLQFHV